MFRLLKGIHNSFRLTAKADSSVVFTDKLQMHVLEACEEKIGRVGDLPPALGAWTNFFYFSHLKSQEEMMSLFQDQQPVIEAYGQLQQFNQDERLRSLDEAHQRFLHDLATDIEAARKEGKVEIVRNMKNEGFGIDIISRITGLSRAEIEQLN